MVNDLSTLAISVAGSIASDAAQGSTVRRPLPPVAMPAEVADAGLIRIGAAVGQPHKRG